MYSIIDIEATGGNAQQGKITEIAILRFDGNSIIDRYSTLVNPKRSIPRYVQKLTGINNAMVADAPTFSDIASDVHSFIDGSCFVAHNVDADYSFIRTEMRASGINFSCERLCTLELSRQLIHEAPSHGLAKICDHLAIEVSNRHRAEGDALATVELFKHILDRDVYGLIPKLKRKK